MLKKLSLYYGTVKYLKWKQIGYRLFYMLRGRYRKFTGFAYRKFAPAKRHDLELDPSIPSYSSYLGNNTFKFLNQEKKFKGEINWNYDGYGKLWTYNLNYFEYLQQSGMERETGLSLIRDYINHWESLKDGLEPYPISLRGINWIKFLTRHEIRDTEIDQNLRAQYHILQDHPEYHLMGNHLLENGCSLLFGAYYFLDAALLQQAVNILLDELNEQVLEDGGHFERSPMYHQILLYRLLDCYNLVSRNTWQADTCKSHLRHSLQKMLGWLRKMTFSDGTIPLLNDTSPGITPNSQALLEYADRLGLQGSDQPIKESGYRTRQQGQTELVLDVGPVGPDYIPGHAHSDTFSFVLYHKGRPVIVDPGTSTYEKNDRRQMERSTCYHNTVMVHEREQSEVWGGFRVGRRAKITELEEKPGTLRAVHDGYVRWGISHERTWKFDEDKLMINDRLKGAKSSDKAAAFFHFGPDVKVTQKNGYLEAGNLKIRFAGANDIQLESYEFCMGFNKRAPAQKISIRFSNQLETTIEI